MWKGAKRLFAGALAGVVMTSACSNEGGRGDTSPPRDAGLTELDVGLPIAAALDAGLRTDDQVVAVMAVGDQRGIDAGVMAQAQAQNRYVEAFAVTMVKDHSAALQRVQALVKMLALTPAPNAVGSQLEADGVAAAAQLRTLTGAAFDPEWLAAEVTACTRVLDVIDTVLMPAAHAEALRSELADMRVAITTHLGEAMTLQAELPELGGRDASVEGAAPDGN